MRSFHSFPDPAMTIPVQVSLFQSCSSIRSVIAAGIHNLSPRAAPPHPYQRWPPLQNPERPSPHQSLTLCSTSWCMGTQTLTYKSQRTISIKNDIKHCTALNSTFILWLTLVPSPWDRNIFDFFEVQIDYLQVPCRHWRCDIWRSNQTTNQHIEDMKIIQKSPPICSQFFNVELWPLG